MKNYERGELAKDILLAFLSVGAAAGLTATFIAFPGLAYVFKLFNAKNNSEKTRVWRSVKVLEHRGYIQICKTGGIEKIKITPLGKQEAIQHSLEHLRSPKPKQWDGLWRIIMFDIPEDKRRARNALRFSFQKMGFFPIQKSVFVYPYPCKKEIDFIANYFQIRRMITYAVARRIEGGPALKRKFKL